MPSRCRTRPSPPTGRPSSNHHSKHNPTAEVADLFKLEVQFLPGPEPSPQGTDGSPLDPRGSSQSRPSRTESSATLFITPSRSRRSKASSCLRTSSTRSGVVDSCDIARAVSRRLRSRRERPAPSGPRGSPSTPPSRESALVYITPIVQHLIRGPLGPRQECRHNSRVAPRARNPGQTISRCRHATAPGPLKASLVTACPPGCKAPISTTAPFGISHNVPMNTPVHG